MKKNIPWINYVKAICVLFVFWIHCGSYYGYEIPSIAVFVHPFYVNGFFFISGYLLFRKQLSAPIVEKSLKTYLKSDAIQYLCNLVFKLILPSVIFSAITFLPSYLLRGRPINITEFLLKTVCGGTYWFVSALIVAELLIFILLLTRRKTVYFYFAVTALLCIGGIFLCKNGLDYAGHIQWFNTNSLLAIGFLGLGGVYWKLESICSLINKWIVVLLAAVYGVLLFVKQDAFQVLVSMCELNLLGVCISTLGIVVLIEVCKRIRKANALEFIGKNSMGFYFFSGGVPVVCSMVANKVFPKTTSVGLIIVFAVSVSISFVAVWIISKYMPFLYDIRKIRKQPQ